MPEVYPEHLEFNGRRKIPTSEFKEEDRLFHGFTVNDIAVIVGIPLVLGIVTTYALF